MSSQRSSWGWVAAGLVLSCVALFAYAPIFAVDFFWHLKLGELIAYLSFRVFGLHGVRCFQVATMLGSFVALGVVARRILHSVPLTFAWCALGLALFEDRFQARPSATMLGFCALALPLLTDAAVRRSMRGRWYAFGLACVWSNMHGGESLLLVLCLGALGVGAVLEQKPEARERAFADARITLVALAGICSSPAFFAGLGDWARLIGPQLSSRNKEWLPSVTMLENGWTASHVLVAFAPTVLFVAYVFEQVRRWRAGERAYAEWILATGLSLLAQLTVRNAFLAIVPVLFMASRAHTWVEARPVARALNVVAGCLFILVALYDHVIDGYGGIARAAAIIGDDLAPNAFPTETTRFMQEAEIEGKIINDGRWGGYLIWSVWPRCHVFADSRHDFTLEMWPVFLASQDASRRTEAMNHAFSEWGIELSMFRGPTFPLITPAENWELLFKAGDQELYQHRDGAHASRNRERARRWLSTRVADYDPHSDYATAATRAGASLWLSATAQRRRAELATMQSTSANAEERRQGFFDLAELAFDAGDYARADALLTRMLQEAPDDVLGLYRRAFTRYLLGDRRASRAALVALGRHTDELTRGQMTRLFTLERALGPR